MRSLCIALFCLACCTAQARTYTVANSDDSGKGTLRDLVGMAQEGDTIAIPASIEKIITISGPIPILVDDLTIQGEDPSSAVILSGNKTHRVFQMQGKGIHLKNLHLTEGVAKGPDNGYRVFQMEGEETPLKNLHLTEGIAKGPDNGHTASLNALFSVVGGNGGNSILPSSGGGGGGLGAGGGLVVNGNLTVTNISITGNSAVGGNGGNGTVPLVAGGSGTGGNGGSTAAAPGSGTSYGTGAGSAGNNGGGAGGNGFYGTGGVFTAT